MLCEQGDTEGHPPRNDSVVIKPDWSVGMIKLSVLS